MRFTDMIAYQARLDPERPAIVAGDKIVTYGMLEQAVRSVCAHLAPLNLPPGSIVGMSIEAPARHLAVSLALARSGLVSAPFASYTALMRLPDMAVVLADQTLRLNDGKLSIAVGDDWFAPLADPSQTPAAVAVADHADCRLYFSSGTTGTPKQIIETFGGLGDQLLTGVFLQTVAGDLSRLLCLMGLTSAWGYRFTISGLAYGMTMYFASGPEEIVRTIMVHRCQYLVCSVHQLQSIVESQQKRLMALPSLLAVCTGGSMVPLELVRATQATLTQRVMVAYGSSELGLTSLEVANVSDWHDGVTGFITPWTEAEVLDDEGQKLAAGEEGELRLRARGQAKFRGEPAGDGGLQWFYPGDRGTISADGRLAITGRTIDIINVGGAKMSSERIEHLMIQHPDVKDAGVLGVRAADGRTSIRAAIVSAVALEEADLRLVVAPLIPATVALAIVRVDAVPRGENSKIQREALRELLR